MQVNSYICMTDDQKRIEIMQKFKKKLWQFVRREKENKNRMR